MKIVIDIPEEICNEIKETKATHEISAETFIRHTAYLELAVENGTPLPKGHGRLIDADALDIDNLDRAYDGNFELDFGRLYTEDVVNMIESAPTIIEADKGEE